MTFPALPSSISSHLLGLILCGLLSLAWVTAVPEPLPAFFHPPDSLSRALSSGQSKRLLQPFQAQASFAASAAAAASSIRSKPPPERWQDLELLDTVLVGTVDGGLHAVERSTGKRLWSRLVTRGGKSVVSYGQDNSQEVGNMDRSGSESSSTDDQKIHSAHGVVQELQGRDKQEEVVEPSYILDPYDGQLYIHSDGEDGGEGTLHKLPKTIEQLVELSPFTFPQEPSHSFIGSRSTSLFSIDLQTGEDVGKVGRGGRDCIIDRPSLKGQHGTERDGRCEVNIEDRPEDRLFIGQTDYHLQVYSSTSDIPIQDLHYTKLVPNSVHRDLAEYWKTTGNVKGESHASSRSRSRSSAYASSSFAAASAVGRPRTEGDMEGQNESYDSEEPGEERWIKTEVEMEDRWRIEALHDGTIVGIEQGKEMRWFTPLPSLAVAIYDILLPTIPGSQPILLPQPPAFLPSLFREEGLNLRLVSMDAVTYLAPLPDQQDPQSQAAIANNVFAMSSNNWPLVGFAPKAEPGQGLIGAWRTEDAVNERLPPLLDPSAPGDSVDDGTAVTVINDSRPVTLATTERKLRGLRRWLSEWSTWKLTLLVIVVVALSFVTGSTIVPVFVPTRISMGVNNTLAISEQLSRRRPTNGSASTIKDDRDETGPEGSDDSWLVVEETSSKVSTASEKPLPLPPSHEIADVVLDQHPKPKPSNTRRRKRGKKNRGKVDKDGSEEEVDGERLSDAEVPPVRDKEERKFTDLSEVESLGAITGADLDKKVEPEHVIDRMEGLTVSDEVLGLGSHGTVVYKGVFQGRAVAVKRLLNDFVTIASQEVSLLQASDDHQNVIRYFCQESRGNFLYIALELCPASLADIIEAPDCYQDLAVAFNAKKALQQVTSGLRHLHGLKIIHRDIKPQNVLVSVNKNGSQRMLLSDFGLAKRLDHGQSSYQQTGKHAIGSVGWRAPECLKGEVQLDEVYEGSSSASGSTGHEGIGATLDPSKRKPGARLTKAVDLFALGCLYFYVLTGGQHVFGERYEREVNIMRDDKVALPKLASFAEDGYESTEIVTRLLSPSSTGRPDTEVCLQHPIFWSPARKLGFLCDASDRFEIMELSPPEPTLIELESKAQTIVGNSWQKRLDTVFLENLGKHRKYDSKSLRDLLRALRNKKHHYQDLPDNVKRRLGSLPAGFLHYFTSRFPLLFMHVHDVVSTSKLRRESMFLGYFEVDE